MSKPSMDVALTSKDPQSPKETSSKTWEFPTVHESMQVIVAANCIKNNFLNDEVAILKKNFDENTAMLPLIKCAQRVKLFYETSKAANFMGVELTNPYVILNSDIAKNMKSLCDMIHDDNYSVFFRFYCLMLQRSYIHLLYDFGRHIMYRNDDEQNYATIYVNQAFRLCFQSIGLAVVYLGSAGRIFAASTYLDLNVYKKTVDVYGCIDDSGARRRNKSLELMESWLPDSWRTLAKDHLYMLPCSVKERDKALSALPYLQSSSTILMNAVLRLLE